MTAVFLAIIVPFVCACIVPFLARRLQGTFFIAALTAGFVSALAAVLVVSGGPLEWRLAAADWLSLSLAADGFSVFMAAVSAGMALAIGVYARGYFHNEKDLGGFYFWTLTFVGAMIGLVFSANLVLMLCFWEITSVCSWKLIAFYRKDKDLAAADKAFLVTFFGASLMLAGIVLVYLQYGTLELSALRGVTLDDMSACLILAGIIAKSAQLPLQSWLPDAGRAPTPVTALLHAAVLVKIGVYAFARIFNVTLSASPEFYMTVVGISALTILVAAGAALVEKDMKRILAYSTISQLGYIMLVLGLHVPMSLKIGCVYILAHSIAKGGLFLCAGNIEHACGTKDITRLGGLAKTMPRTAGAYVLCALSIIGIPPLFGFWPKMTTIMMTIDEGYLAAGIAAVAGAMATLLYLMRLYNAAFAGEVKIAAREERNSPMVWVVVALGMISLALGIFFRIPMGLIERMISL